MKRWSESTYIFISTNPVQHADGVEARWIPVMLALQDKGANVRFLVLQHSEMGEAARKLGIGVDPYILDKWNVIRSRSRLRKYLKRYDPICAHSTGLEGDLLLRWAARKVPGVRIAHTLAGEPQRTRRRKPVDAMMLRLDELGMHRADAVLLETAEFAPEILAAGVAPDAVLLDPPGTDTDANAERVQLHLGLYRSFMAGR